MLRCGEEVRMREREKCEQQRSSGGLAVKCDSCIIAAVLLSLLCLIMAYRRSG
jgi:hypothetical protein